MTAPHHPLGSITLVLLRAIAPRSATRLPMLRGTLLFGARSGLGWLLDRRVGLMTGNGLCVPRIAVARAPGIITALKAKGRGETGVRRAMEIRHLLDAFSGIAVHVQT